MLRAPVHFAAMRLPPVAVRALVLAGAAVLSACATAPPPGLVVTPADDPLARRVGKIAGKAGGARFGVAALHVESGRSLSWNADDEFEGASVVKIALLLEAAARQDEGTIDWNDRWLLTRKAVADGSGWLDEFEPGLYPSNRDLVRLMIAISDNTAANSFIDRFGQDAVNERMRGLGLGGIRLLGRIPDRPDTGESPEWRNLVLSRMTPAATALYYRKIVDETLIDPYISRRVRDVLRAQHYLDRVPRLLADRPGHSWAGKTGTMRAVRNDSGILTTPKGHFVLVVFVDRIPPGKESAARGAMGEVAAAIVDDWSASLPDLPPAPETPLPPRYLPATSGVAYAPTEADATSPDVFRVLNGTDRRFWDLWRRAGGEPSDACLSPVPNSWWELEKPMRLEPVSALVLHHTSMETDQECVDLFRKPESVVSSHFLVGRDGRLWQFVSLDHRAFHAGRSNLHGRQALNRTSIGVEITGDGNRWAYTRAQVETLVRLVGVLTALFDIQIPWIAGHEHVAPERKPDPGRLFPWNEVVRRGLTVAEGLRDGAGAPFEAPPPAPGAPGLRPDPRP